ncbi:glycoside hydrolase family 3 N-terminal domain-containing protein [Georgenia sp. H159]|uniref:beta-xylosidase/alpha-l-arabinosidase n=1 Tax=Georgenia sp. H159 TaxID=3076115 RepID=UPI002D76ADE1|nr:glycoside hydrolase family 3 N-terminal domain-containing protein [Georgenia sp. H159]
MTLDEKLAQVVGLWVGAGSDGEVVAPLQDAMLDDQPSFTQFARHGLGHLTRVFGTRPVEPEAGRRALRESQRWLVENTRLGIPAIAHEECLTGLAAWRATTFPTPLAWGAAFDPALVEQMGAAIGSSMAALGVHQGLAPVLDVVRDPRWGRVEECIGEDPYLVGTVGTAYVRGLQSAGVHATLKHFVGYSASQAGRNLAPVHAGPREVADVLLPPFEMALRDGDARSVMHSYSEIDGVPVAADPELLTELLREQWGFDGTVVADYFGVAFLHLLHGVAADLGEAAEQALAAGIDVELPTGNAYLTPLRERVEDGRTPIELVDRAVLRILRQKEELGLLDEDFSADLDGAVDLDPTAHRELARRLAERSLVLLSNDGTLPLVAPGRVAVVGPNADRSPALFGCYSFVNHVIPQHPGTEPGIEAPSVLDALRSEFPSVTYAAGCAVDDDDRSGIADAVARAEDADLAVVVVGDQSGLFGRGTVGEGCDRDDLELPGVQRELVEAVLATGTPVVLVLLTGRPYVLDWALERCSAVVQGFFPGEEGAAALADVLTGRVNPSGRLPVSLPRSAGSQPSSYLHARLAGPSETSNLDPTPVLPFGHGLSYTTFTHSALTPATTEVATSEAIELTVRVRNTGTRAGSDVVQLYARDVAASVTRPVAQLMGYCRVDLEPGEEVTVHFAVPTTRLAFSDRRMCRVVEPGAVELWVGPSCAERETEARVELVGGVHEVRPDDDRWVRTEVTRS